MHARGPSSPHASTVDSVHIRIATESDIAAMHRIRMSVRENALADPSRVQAADYRALLHGSGRAWVAEADGRIIGFAIADLRRANVWALFVEPDCEGRGVGRALHDQLVEWLFASGVSRVWLTTTPATRAERFYKAAGWQYAGMQQDEARYELSRRDWRQHSGRIVPPAPLTRDRADSGGGTSNGGLDASGEDPDSDKI